VAYESDRRLCRVVIRPSITLKSSELQTIRTKAGHLGVRIDCEERKGEDVLVLVFRRNNHGTKIGCCIEGVAKRVIRDSFPDLPDATQPVPQSKPVFALA
jgi:hypothetical protein